MASNIKGITVEIGGNTTGLSKALNDVNKNCNTLQSELKTVDRLLKLDPNNLVLVKQKQDLLKESISQTKDKLSTLNDVQAQVNQQFKNGEIGADQYRAFNREVEQTKQKLSDLKQESKSISVVGTAANGAKEKMSQLHAKLEPIENGFRKIGSAAKGGFDVAAGAVNIATKGLSMYATAVAGAGTALFGLCVKSGKAADDINTLSKQTGLSTEQIQKFTYASDLIDVPLETLTGSMAKLTKNMGTAQEGTGKAAEAFKALGVNITDQNGQLRNNQDVFNESIAALGKMENSTQRDALAMQIFGKSAQDLNPLILGGADALKELGNNADEMGLILSQSALDNLNGFNDSIDILKANANGAGMVLGGTFAGMFKPLMDEVGTSLPNIASSISRIFSGINVKESTQILQGNLTSIVTLAMNSLVANLPAFLKVINTLILSVVNAITTILPTFIQDVLPALITGFTDLVVGLVQALPVLIPLLMQGAITLFMGLIDGLNTVVPFLMEQLPTMITQIVDTLIQNLPAIIEGGFQLIIGLIVGIANAAPTLITKIIELIPVIVKALMDNLPALVDAGLQLIIGVSKGIIQAIPLLLKSLPQVITSIVNGLKGSMGKMVDVGKDMIRGIWDGIMAMGTWLKNKVSGFFSGILNGIKSLFGIHSPSTVFRDEIGKFMAQGIGVGFTGEIENVMPNMKKSLSGLVGDIAVDMKTGEKNPLSVQPMKQNINLNVVSVMDGKEVGYGAAKYTSRQQSFIGGGSLGWA